MAQQRGLILSPPPQTVQSALRAKYLGTISYPLHLVLPKKGRPSVLGGLRGGASEIIFEENLERELRPTLEKYLFLGHGLLRKISLAALFDYCFPVITTTDMDLLGQTVIEMFKEALGASFGIL